MLQSCWLKCWLIWALSHNRCLLLLSLLTPEDYRQTFLCTRLKHWSRAKKSMPCLIKLQDVQQITCLKQQRSLSFIFCKTQRSYKKIMCICYFIGSVVKIVLSEAATGGVLYKKFTKFTGNYKCQSLFLNKFAGEGFT